MTHSDETYRLWKRVQQQAAYDRWAAFFVPLIGEIETVKVLCDLGMKIVRGQAEPGAATRAQAEAVIENTMRDTNPKDARERGAGPGIHGKVPRSAHINGAGSKIRSEGGLR
ncbi:MAG: hypothetical protein HY287_18080 [Planctomycetes bacterium]|nr:hypothetical protein [Planctomycetota bacterium]